MDDTLALLRRRIREIEGQPIARGGVIASGPVPWDHAAGGLPRPGVVEVAGPMGSGRTRLALSWLAEPSQRGRRVAWIDPEGRLYPPSAAALGVSLKHLLLVRPPEDQLAWTTDQVLRSGCFDRVVLAVVPELRGVAGRWRDGVRQGACTLIVLTERPCRALPADLRLVIRGREAVVQRQRGAHLGRAVALPSWPAPLDPFDGGGASPWD